MSEIQVASRYAKSLIDLSNEQGSLEQVKADMVSFINVLRTNPELQAVLKNPIINTDKKIGILTQLFGQSFHKIIITFFSIVVNKGRAGILYATAKEFINQYNLLKGIVKATVISASALSESNRTEIIRLLEDTTKSSVQLESKIDEDLIGGFVLKVGDKQYDASIASSLQKLKKEFSQKV
ncbi:ATP synthase F1 subunit delta [Desertivirga xinjiangensis]|uniref:ATP synthase F1 subunit delta n=1 Tax=Desertivirga xinjiangensis TaxID=539206 RepID=UPI00210CCDE0|nr:ATP synthase F1 subunit delta [Pedobacter xinjiangensis]